MVGLGRVVVPVEPEEDSDPLSRSALRCSRESVGCYGEEVKEGAYNEPIQILITRFIDIDASNSALSSIQY